MWVALTALAAAVLGKWSGVPAGALSAALIVSAGLKLGGKCPGMPPWLRRAAQVASGCCIGSAVTRGQLLQMGQLALPAAALCLGYMVCCVGMGLVGVTLVFPQIFNVVVTVLA